MKTPVSALLQTKGNDVVTVGADETVFDTIRVMAGKAIGAVLVVNPQGKLEGVLSERDCFNKVILQEKSPREVHAWEIMTRDPVTITDDRTLEDCMALMTQRHIRHLPVVKADRILGVISMRDVIRHLCEEQNRMIANLEKYIDGSL